MTVHYVIVAFLPLMCYVTLTLHSGHMWQVMWSIPPPSLKILQLSVLKLHVTMSPMGHYWQCICSHWACTVTLGLCVWGRYFPHIRQFPQVVEKDIKAFPGPFPVFSRTYLYNVRNLRYF